MNLKIEGATNAEDAATAFRTAEKYSKDYPAGFGPRDGAIYMTYNMREMYPYYVYRTKSYLVVHVEQPIMNMTPDAARTWADWMEGTENPDQD